MNSSDQIPVGAVDELGPGQRKLAFINGRGVVLFNIDGAIHAIDNACPHQGASIANGRLDGGVLSCPAHGLRFDLRTGRMPGVSGLSLTTFPVQTIGGKLFVSIEDPVASPAPAPACNAAS
ncbi:3-phenylpropionate/trans-cinnamate dioxygenase ferredoxin subunit [Paraburkholderia sp. BL18I3N2]|uniref:Rieske (2Fe-2S) protein n=1 Tax=Paraburkholderia sp. BL18I3N2 TaxID=1938799 RepID=UPI000D07E6AB|nr:Rieske 2Fe-2S domain-containing protein [Paraburkholderia sp. BL18I3N2]PRX32175.1 3-phenylpropionate/trans-cinnamate dioxygenase ferredoxin subunit [Paraburkholderia sp. BL18I3N2]